MAAKTTLRGYGNAHQLFRKHWRSRVEAGGVECVEPVCLRVEAGGSRLIMPGERWHLSHDRATGEWLGPSHEACNTSEGAKFGARLRKFQESPFPGVPGRTRW